MSNQDAPQPLAPPGARRRRAAAAFVFAAVTTTLFQVGVARVPALIAITLVGLACYVTFSAVSLDTLARRLRDATPSPVDSDTLLFSGHLKRASWYWSGAAALLTALMSLTAPVWVWFVAFVWWLAGPQLLSAVMARWDRKVGEWVPVRVVADPGEELRLVPAEPND